MARIGYLVHDLADAAVARRIAMFRAGGASVSLAGFLRNESPMPEFEGLAGPPLLLARTRDARLVARALSVLNVGVRRLGTLEGAFSGAETLVARNLEMLAVAAALRARLARRRGHAPRLVYECLDIHRLLTARSAQGRTLRHVERRLAGGVDLVVTSSPAFVRHHLGAVFDAPIPVVENKVPRFDGGAVPPAAAAPPGPPWRIGWFGMLRCRRSFALLADLARQCGGQVEVVLRGRPSPAEFPDFDRAVAAAPHLSFGGPYRGAAELAEAYAAVHFAWCIDFFEEGHNSAWLLPNRLYESAYHNTVPLALGSVETGRRLRNLGAGLVVEDESRIGPELFLEMTEADYSGHLARLAAQPPGTWSSDAQECRAVVRAVLGHASPDLGLRGETP